MVRGLGVLVVRAAEGTEDDFVLATAGTLDELDGVSVSFPDAPSVERAVLLASVVEAVRVTVVIASVSRDSARGRVSSAVACAIEGVI